MSDDTVIESMTIVAGGFVRRPSEQVALIQPHIGSKI
jgi:hypothetical protein